MIKKIDLFGSQMPLRFHGSPSFHTNFGSIVTIMIVGFISFRLFFIVLDVFQRTNPQVIYNERQVDNPSPFLANSKTFPMAFAMEDPITNNYYIDESIYTITARWRQKILVFNQTTNQYVTVWNITNIKLQTCTLDNFQNLDNQNYYKKLNYTSMYCLPPDFQYTIQGDFNSEKYSLIELIVKQCSKNCKSKTELDYYLQKANFGLQLSDSYVDPTVKNYPFKIYSRDLFWRTSTHIPKDVTLYIRNNYVYSDFGWFFSDINTEKLPSFSYYEVSDYPPNSQNYFISVLMRFEKQKEGVYKRTYKNFNNIMSEIGGFTQSLLALGYLICKKFSQIKLNLELINNAFKYDESNGQENKKSTKPEKNQKSQSPNQKTQSPNQKTHSPNQKTSKLKQQYKEVQEFQIKHQALRKRNFLVRRQSLNEKSEQSEVIQNSQLQSAMNVNSINQSQSQIELKNNKKDPQICNENVQFNQEIDQQKNDQMNNQQINIYDILNGLDDSDYIKNKEIKVNSFEKGQIYQQQKQRESQFKQLMDKKTKSMKISTWEYFKSLFFPSDEYKKKRKIIKYSVDKLYYNLDIFNILKKLVEIEKLKRLLLDQDQLKLFDYLPKPTISSDLVMKQELKESWDQKNKEIDLLYQDYRSDLQKANDAFQAYQKIIKKQNSSNLDQKLVDLVDPNLLKIFQDAADQQHTYQTSPQEKQNFTNLNTYEQFLLSQNNQQIIKNYQNNLILQKKFQQSSKYTQDVQVVDLASLNQSNTSSIQEEFFKLEVRDKISSNVKQKINSSLDDRSSLTTTNVLIKNDQQNIPNEFKTNLNKLSQL